MLEETQIFNNNSIYVYFLSCIVIISYQHFSKKQRISLIYATTIAMEIISQYSWKITSVMLFTSMFILEEYLCDDSVKCDLLSNFWYKAVDFIYQFIFIDVGVGIVINVIASGKEARSFIVSKTICLNWFYGINIFILLITIHLLNTSKFELCDFKTIKSYFDKFDGRKINLDSDELQRRFDIMIALEDKSYFVRKSSYNWFSVEFIRYKVKKYKEKKKRTKLLKRKKSFDRILKALWSLVRKLRLFKYIISIIKSKLSETTWSIKNVFLRFKRKIRGCSTLEMQLIRNIGIEKGYDECVIRRKFFEFFYTYLFFNGLKKYYENTQNNKRKNFKKFILYVYLHSIKVSIGGNDFKTVNMMFEEERVEEWDIDEFYVAILSLTGAPVTPKRMVLYPSAVNNAGIDLNRALAWRNLIKAFGVTETHKENLAEESVEKVFYVIRNKIIPYIEAGIFYGPNDGKNDWPTYGESNCWSFAMTVYVHIWEEKFSNKTGTDDDMMRVYNSLKDRTITTEHCQMYLGNAEPGAVIRICDEIKGNDRMGRNRHSQILLDYDQNGLTIYESNNERTIIAYYTWKEYADKYAKYKYFKYIKWPVYAHKVTE